ncbi:TRAP transporter substrate-binding protein DctP [Bacillus dakarensis]|uniref:TRAP transporter substrate-binding protein DctP n=1 Tax=Robertmurraya dakarensis TaxID=1926278 RepID=UPI000980A0B8|nr:TRAP transporter substrate-binding protein DctP [Bacillus dakarensis]
MKLKNIFFSITMISIFVLILSACVGNQTSNTDDNSNDPNSPNKNEVIELDLNTWLPSTHHNISLAYEPWAKIVDEKTNGRVKINILTGGALGGSGTHLEDLQGGLYDITHGTIGYYPDTDLFKLTVFDLPFAFENTRDASDAITKYFELHGTGDWPDKVTVSKKGVTTDPYVLFSTKEIRTVEDLKGMKIRVASDVWNEVLKSLGATPVFMPNDELYAALDRGVVDAATYSPIGAQGLKLYEPAPYILNFPLQTIGLDPMIRTGALEEMSEDLRELFVEELLPELSELLIQDVEKLLPEIWNEYEQLIEGRGEIITWSEEEKNKFKRAAETAWDMWVETANQKGYDGDQIMEEFKQIRKDLGLQPVF